MTQAGFAQPEQGWKQQFGAFVFVLQALSFMWAVYTRVPGTMGRHYFQGPAVLGLLLGVPLAIACVPPTYGAQCLNWFWIGMGFMLFVHAAARQIRLKRREQIHSKYIGDSIFSRLFPKWSMNACRSAEIPLAIVLAVALVGVCETISACIAVSAIADMLVTGMGLEAEKRRTESAVDAWLEAEVFNQHVNERLRR